MRCCALLLVGLFGCFPAVSAEPPLTLENGDVVAFVGGTDLVRLQKDGRLEAALSNAFREARPRFRDLAWEGDTVGHQSTVRERWRREAFGDLDDQLERVEATVVIAQFGKMESLAGADGLAAFREATRALVKTLAGKERRVVLLEPFPPEWDTQDASHLPAYTAALREMANTAELPFVRSSNATELVTNFGLEPAPDTMLAAVREKHRLWFDYWRPANWKCLFGDDSRRIFSVSFEGRPSLRDEWKRYPELIAAAEAAIYGDAPYQRPDASPLRGSDAADPEREQAAFEVLDGYEVNLFADERHGIANPLAIRWDSAGRAYVICSDTYPHVEPGVLPNDRVVRLVDHDADGRADQATRFAEGLNIPTGLEIDHDLVYVGQGTELITLRDTDDDGFADERQLLLSGFGNGDSHQALNSFAWSPDGELWFCQGDGIESRVETPHGIAGLFQAGVFRLRPRSLQLHGLLDDFGGPGNPWGIVFDDFGQSFVADGAGGISYLTPASIPARRHARLPRIGPPGGYCGMACVGASNTAELNGHFLLGDYKRNRVSRFRAVPLGPDGAIYVVDWYNPVTCHQDDFFRHPERDKTHGRIWRIAPVGRAALAVRDWRDASVAELAAALGTDERHFRRKAKQVLASHEPGAASQAVRAWAAASEQPRDLVAALGALTLFGTPDLPLLERALAHEDVRLRAYATRIAGRWQPGRLESAAGDAHPRVRLEALLAAGQLREPGAVRVIARAVEGERDKFIEYAFTQAAHHTRSNWQWSHERGLPVFGAHEEGMREVLKRVGAKPVAPTPRGQVFAELFELDPDEALARARRLLSSAADAELITEVFAGFVARKGGGKQLAGALAGIEPAQALRLREVWFASGLADSELTAGLERLSGMDVGVLPEYSAAAANAIAAAAQSRGDAERGAKVFASARAGCVACHRAAGPGGAGGVFGPDLSALGSAVLPDRIVTEVLWPAQHVKEGYSLVAATLKNGEIAQGFAETRRDKDKLFLRDPVSGIVREIPQAQVAGRKQLGSAMPPTAQALNEEQRLDLFAFLFSLRGDSPAK